MKTRVKSWVLLLFMLLIGSPLPARAHPAATDADGCHTCRTNCARWGLDTGEHHCHDSKVPTLSVPSLPLNTPTPEPAPTPTPDPFVVTPPRIFNEKVTVLKVLNGETVEVSWKVKDVLEWIDHVERVRLIGVKALPHEHPQESIPLFADNAYGKLRESLVGQMAHLQIDRSQGDRDAQKRLLRYMWLEETQLLNLILIQYGYVLASTGPTPHQYRLQFQHVQDLARKQKKGLWALAGIEGEQGLCPIKGIIGYGGAKFYVLPEDTELYSEHAIDQAQGERWFCSESEAQTAGWKRLQ